MALQAKSCPPRPFKDSTRFDPKHGIWRWELRSPECVFNQAFCQALVINIETSSSRVPVFSNFLKSACVSFPVVLVCCTCGRDGSCDVCECGSDYRRTSIRQLTRFYIQPHTPPPHSPLLNVLPFILFSPHLLPFYQTFGRATTFYVIVYRKMPFYSTLSLVPMINTCKLLK